VELSTGTRSSGDWAGGRPETATPSRLPDRLRYGRLGRYIAIAREIPGWTRGDEAVELAQASRDLPRDAVVVELGSFLGCSTVLLAGGRRVAGSGRVHSIDPFDASGDAFSIPVYRAIQKWLRGSLREEYDRNVARADLAGYVTTHVGRAEKVAAGWTLPIDMLFMDGDQSREGARSAYELWAPFLKVGGLLAVHSSTSTEEHHDGSYVLANEVIVPPQWAEKRLVRITTFARKVRDRK
jgi:predicted O-methyltransferase YrrM